MLAARKMAGGHSSRSWTARRNLILEKGVIYRRTVSNHRGGRKKSYLMEKILCPTVLRANNWRTPRKVAYIALLSRGANTIRSGAFCRWKNLARTNRFFELPAFSKKWMYADRVCIDETLRCWWKLWRISFFLSFFWVIYGPLDVDMICTTVVNTVSLCFVPLNFIFDLTCRFILSFKSVHQLLLKSWSWETWDTFKKIVNVKSVKTIRYTLSNFIVKFPIFKKIFDITIQKIKLSKWINEKKL